MAEIKYVHGVHGPDTMYQSPTLKVYVGQVVDVPEETAIRLVADFGICFERVEAPVKAPRTVVAIPVRKGVESLLRGAGFTDKQIGQIERAGLLNAGLSSVPDAALLALKGFGPGRVAKLRKALKGGE